jgi:translation initiation factor IF-3
MSVRDAIEKAQGESLDLVEVAANENPPVCRIVDFGKYLYDDKKKKQETKRKQTKVEVKECKFRPKIGDHDFDVRIRRAVKFLSQGNKVKLTVMFRGREHAHPEVAQALIERAFEEIKDLGKMEAPPRKEGRDMHVIVTPLPRDIRNKAMKARGIDPDQNKADLARDIKQKQDEERGITSSDDLDDDVLDDDDYEDDEFEDDEDEGDYEDDKEQKDEDEVTI